MVPFGVSSCVYKMDKFGNCVFLDQDSLLGGGQPNFDLSRLSQLQLRCAP